MVRRWTRWIAPTLLLPALLGAQGGVGYGPLSLARAIELARTNSPTYAQALNDGGPAAAATRAAYGSLFPTIGSSMGMGYSRAGSQTLANQVFSQRSSTISSSYSIGVSWSLSYAELVATSQAKTRERLVEENITGAGVQLVSDVTQQYLAAKRAGATIKVAEQQLARNQEFLDIAEARAAVGQGNAMEVQQARVSRGSAEVQLLRARQTEADAKLELMRLMGLQLDGNLDAIVLTDEFVLDVPSWTAEELIAIAIEHNPSLRSSSIQQQSADLGVRSARAAYLPSFSISSGLSGYTQQSTNTDALIASGLAGAQGSATNCAFQNAILERLTSPHPAPNGGIIPDCLSYAGLDASGTQLDPARVDAIREANSKWPFAFTRSPISVSFGVSLPLWDGFSRSARMSEARAAQDDARESSRATRLQVESSIRSALRAVTTARQAADMEAATMDAAHEQLSLARERFRVGMGTALEVTDAQNAATQAEVAQLNAIHDYHLAVARLETLVGRPLR